MAGNRFVEPHPQFLDANGDPLSSGTLTYYEAGGTSTLQEIYTDKELSVEESNPLTLDAGGYLPNSLFLQQLSYNVVAKNSLGAEQWSEDDVSNILQVDITGVPDADTYAELTSLAKSSLTDLIVYQVNGRTTKGDIEPVSFQWNAASSTTENGGTILESDEGGTGRWLMVFFGPVNVKWFNAKGDNSTDDTAAIQAALDTLLDVFIPVGTYLYDNLTSSADNQKFTGEGWDSIVSQNIATGSGLTVTHDSFTIRDLRTNGDGTFNQSSAVANNDRRALVKVTGDDFTSENVLYNDGPQNCLHLDSMTGAKILKNKVIGGVASQTDTAYQGIRVTDCSDVTVDDNLLPGGSNQYVIGIFFATFSGVSANNTVVNNNIGGTFDNGIYMINSQGCNASNNETVSDSSGVVMVGTSFVGGEVPGNIVANNICEASASTPSETVGIYMRDANNSVCNDNHVFDFPTGIQVAPVQHDNAGNEMSNNEVCNNVIKGWTVAGITHSKLALNLGDSSNNKFNDNILIAGTSTSTSVAINANVTQQSAADIAFDNEYSRNTIIGSGNNGISLGFQQRFTVDGNKITDAAIAGGTLKTGIYLPDCSEGSASNNRIKDTVGSVMLSGIDGNDTCTESDFFNNTIRGTATSAAPLRRLHASDNNSFRGNRTGSNPLHGTVTMDADASTTVANNNINTGLGMESYVNLTPINAAAGTLIGSSECPYVRTADHVDRTSFFINTADAGNAAGTEQYFYEIIQ